MSEATNHMASGTHESSGPSRRTVVAGLIAGTALGGAAMAAPRYPVVGHVERLDPALDALIDVNASVEQICDGFVWAEGPCWVGGKDGYLLASDPRGNAIIRWSARDGRTDWMRPSGYLDGVSPDLAEPGTNGLCLGRGGLICADSGSRGISQIDLKTKQKKMLCTTFEGKRFNSPNDAIVASDGAIYFTDPPFGLRGNVKSPSREMDYTGVFRLGPDGVVTLIDNSIFPNGIGLSPDERTLYITSRAGWLAWSLDASGRPLQSRVFVDHQATGIMGGDGLRVDNHGNVWASSRDGISIFTPEGKRIGIIRGDDVISNCEFGGDGHLYMTSNHRIIRVKVKAKKLFLGAR